MGHKNPKAKGSSFERLICKQLSLWVSHGEREDVFWRSAMSGGRATVRGTAVRQAGDICAVAPEGHDFTKQFFVECKHVKKLALDQFLIKNTGPLRQFWLKLLKQADRHSRCPMLIARQNGWPTLVITLRGRIVDWAPPLVECKRNLIDVTLFDDMLTSPYSLGSFDADDRDAA